MAKPMQKKAIEAAPTSAGPQGACCGNEKTSEVEEKIPYGRFAFGLWLIVFGLLASYLVVDFLRGLYRSLAS